MVQAVVLSNWGPPEALEVADVEVGPPGAGQILLDVTLAGVGPTDLAIRAGHLKGAFGARPGSVLGFEAAGTVAAVGEGVVGVSPGDSVAAFLPELGGYAGQVLARYWVRTPDGVSPRDAAGMPAAAEAAARVVAETQVAAGETVLIIGAAGSVGLIASQLAVGLGARVLGAVRESDFATVQRLGGTPVASGGRLSSSVRELVSGVDAVIDAAGSGVLATAVDLAGGPTRVVTLSDPRAANLGVRLSVPDAPRIVERLSSVMTLLADGRLRLKDHSVHPLAAAAAVHRSLESGELRTKALLATERWSAGRASR